VPVDTLLAKALGQDVSQAATAEKQLLLSRLLARLAHEIRNPLSSLDIHVQLLEEDLAQLESPPTALGVRLLPPHDPFLLLRDRSTLEPDRSLQRHI